MRIQIASLFLLVSFSFAQAADWTQYRGPAGDGKTSESVDPDRFPSDGPKILWNNPVSLGFSSFTVADGRAFTLEARPNDSGENVETLVAVHADTGEQLWAVPLGKSDYEHDGGNAGARDNRGGDGPRGTPTTDGKHVYVYDAHLVLSCFDASNGQQVWQRDIVKEFAGRNIKWYNATSPVLDGHVLYVAGGGPGRSFLAFDKSTGDVIWQSGDEMLTHATPSVTSIAGVKQVIYFMQSGLVGVEASSGKEIWRAQFPFSVSTAASPIPSGDLVYCSAGYGVGAGLFKVNGKSEADEVWFKANELMNHWSTPIVHDGHLYGIFEFKKYGDAPLQCVELATGEIKWSQRGFGPGNCILAGDKLLVLSDSGELVIVDATPTEYKEQFRADYLMGKCWSTPAYSDGRVYIRSTEEAACIVLNP